MARKTRRSLEAAAAAAAAAADAAADAAQAPADMEEDKTESRTRTASHRRRRRESDSPAPPTAPATSIQPPASSPPPDDEPRVRRRRLEASSEPDPHAAADGGAGGGNTRRPPPRRSPRDHSAASDAEPAPSAAVPPAADSTSPSSRNERAARRRLRRSSGATPAPAPAPAPAPSPGVVVRTQPVPAAAASLAAAAAPMDASADAVSSHRRPRSCPSPFVATASDTAAAVGEAGSIAETPLEASTPAPTRPASRGLSVGQRSTGFDSSTLPSSAANRPQTPEVPAEQVAAEAAQSDHSDDGNARADLQPEADGKSAMADTGASGRGRCEAFNFLVQRLRDEGILGSGTFSTVYKGWQFIDTIGGNRVALKCILQGSDPKRINGEIFCLQRLRDSPNVVNVRNILREADSVVLVLDYFKHTEFKDVYKDLSMSEISLYMRNLCAALADVHEAGIIHRDVKPNNFLFNRETKQFRLVDFGLAQTQEDENVLQDPHEAPPPVTLDKRIPPSSSARRKQTSQTPASRAGTRGFRAPEVLLRYIRQGTGIDMWSAGVIFLSLLSRRYPFFQSPDDMTGLGELIRMFGYERIKALADKLGCELRIEGHGSLDELLRAEGKTMREVVQGLPKAHRRVSDGAFDLLERMLEIDFTKRITAAEALHHPFLADPQATAEAEEALAREREASLLRSANESLDSESDQDETEDDQRWRLMVQMEAEREAEQALQEDADQKGKKGDIVNGPVLCRNDK